MSRIVTAAHCSCHATGKVDHVRRAKIKYAPYVPIAGSFTPPPGTLLLSALRQPDGFTCGTETFIGICEMLRLPLRDPDEDEVEDYKKKLHTTYKEGTDPADIARVARDYLGIEARVEIELAIADLADMTCGAQDYVDALNAGKKPHGPLSIAMITYQAYVLPEHDKSLYFPKGRPGRRQVLPIRRQDGSLIWKDDWSDGHWSAVVRVVLPHEAILLRKLRNQLGDRPRADEILDGVVILADPSNGEGLSFIPLPEFDDRWHDTDRKDRPRFRHAAVIFTLTKGFLGKMQAAAAQQGVPMFPTVARNSVIYVP